ncbi:aminomethyl-transferring glycine dehydrogenase subunit GcvPA [Agromyces aerolatus]|uniref:aminomethyl-transferring glycine dehydrogenase subunit GcvPA n=1 Tax=Agromyces sp. LY-1074 TaxID=3074080 RepID=UPI0028646FFF|nr:MULTISPECIES: aminomethyl-transferring glycine dehydrogenase subunit GcvPA [unclassified Agromyces]MDR5700514.1 aminomethyl-transferring glycine dehydrogenase subunit GcvPA [Agromyces sp. LY-1074]MDR5707035.1 aminomethyl-transferring glycine dehydrogenase subunit GcvPA [Agromyces sp. LY-1358]
MSTYDPHPYMPNSTGDARAHMRAAIGIDDVEELFEQIPDAHRARSAVDLPDGVRSEAELERQLDDLLRANESTRTALSFLGGGLWQHHIPAVCDEIAGRNEFVTSVWGTPSSDHGRLQAWFEFTSQLGALLEMDFVGLPVYSWGSAGGNAVRMAARLTGRTRVLVAETVDPERRQVMQTYAGLPGTGRAIELVTLPFNRATGRIDLSALEHLLEDTIAAVYLDCPNHLGVFESDAPRIAELTHRVGAELIVGVDPISLGVIAPPASYGADIVVGTTQPLGVPISAGGGVGGFIATRDEERYAREFPTLQVSLTGTSTPGERAFGFTLFEQSSYGSREDGNDWTGNSVYLSAIRNTVYMALMGPQGFTELGHTVLGNAHAAARRIAEIDGVSVRFPDGFFKEFVVDFTATGTTVADINVRLRDEGIFGGLDLSDDFTDLGQSALFCVTEVHTEDDIDRLVGALRTAVSA